MKNNWGRSPIVCDRLNEYILIEFPPKQPSKISHWQLLVQTIGPFGPLLLPIRIPSLGFTLPLSEFYFTDPTILPRAERVSQCGSLSQRSSSEANLPTINLIRAGPQVLWMFKGRVR